MATKTFEKAMEQLEKIVQELEHGDLPIEKALRKFEEGVKLSQFCTNKLNETEQKVSLLLKNPDETISEEVFNDENDT